MKTSRRNFLRNAGIVALASTVLLPSQNIFGQSLPNGQLFAIPPESTSDAFNYLKRDHFAAVVNTVFQFQPEEGKPFQMQLLAVEGSSRPANAKQGFTGESFSLLFESAKKSKISQGEYEIAHGALGNFRLFIVPVGLRGNRYEAVINRINVTA